MELLGQFAATALVAAVIYFAARLAIKKSWIGKKTAKTASVALISLWVLFASLSLTPQPEKSQPRVIALREHARITRLIKETSPRAEEFDKIIKDYPFYPVIQQHNPEFWDDMFEQMLGMSEKGKSNRQIALYFQQKVMKLQAERLSYAPDESVIAYLNAEVWNLAQLQKVSDDNCFRSIFPQAKGSSTVAQEIIMQRHDAAVRMIAASYGPNQHAMQEQERQLAQQDVKQILKKMQKKYGQSFSALLNNPRTGIGKEKLVCGMVQDYWQHILMQPEDKAARIIRASMGSQAMW